MTASLTALLAVLFDRLFKEPPRWHPLVGFGWLANRAEAWFYGSDAVAPWPRRLRGLCSLLLLLGGIALPLWLGLRVMGTYAWLGEVILLYLTLGGASLGQHSDEIRAALQAGDLERAREKVGRIVSRDTAAMDESAVVRAGVESVLENGCDAVFGALFWFFVAGAPGAVTYRLANTLDAMWGYKTAHYRHFGWATARLDDALNWIPARLTALTYVLLGSSNTAWRCWREQARAWQSPNAGPVMAAGAGALSVQLGGPAMYHGQLELRPPLGAGAVPGERDIGRAVTLVWRGVWLWLALAGIGGWALA